MQHDIELQKPFRQATPGKGEGGEGGHAPLHLLGKIKAFGNNAIFHKASRNTREGTDYFHKDRELMGGITEREEVFTNLFWLV
jgi:hypothetical protein